MATWQEIKELETPDTPLLIFTCTLASGPEERWSTHNVVVNGSAYEARVLRHNLFELRAGSEDGIDSIPRVSISLANADGHCSQVERLTGWKGAKVTISFVFYDLAAGTYTEPLVVFRGTAGSPDEVTEDALRLTISNRLNLHRLLLPEVRIQRRCPWVFPSSDAQRTEAIDGGLAGSYSRFYRCGYSAGLAGGSGTLNGAEPFTECNYTRADCEARGMFDRDGAGAETRRFGGIEFVPSTVLVRSHGERGWRESTALENETRYNDVVPLIYGTAWLQPPIVFARNDGNLTRIEVLLGLGPIEGVLKVLVNGVEIPLGQANVDMTSTGWHQLVSAGARNGAFNSDYQDETGRPLGDPYGGMAYLSVVVPNHLAGEQRLPKVEVLMQGMKTSVYDIEGVNTGVEFNNNPAWVLLDVLRRTGWGVEEVDVASFARAAAVCDELINSRDLYGNEILLPRYQVNLVLRKRRSAAEVVRGLRKAAALCLAYNSEGKLRAVIERTLAGESPEKPIGSNSDVPLNGGWPAYEFGDGSTGTSGILRKENGASSLRVWTRGTSETPNRLTAEFQNALNEYQQDSLSLVDVDDVLRSGQEVSAAHGALGLPNLDQAARVMRLQLDKLIRGNTYVEFETSVRAVSLRPGDLIALTYQREGFVRQPFRVLRVEPGLNYGTAVITAQLHDDAWYTDASGATESSAGRRSNAAEVGLPRPLIGAESDAQGRAQLTLSENATEAADGTIRVSLEAGFVAPSGVSKSGLGAPLISLTPRVDVYGGALPGGRNFYYAVAPLDSAGVEGGLSFVVRATTPTSTNTNLVIIEDLRFAPGTTAFNVYRGDNPALLWRIASSLGVSDTFSDVGNPAQLIGPPDPNYDHANLYWRRELLPPLSADIFSDSTIGSSTLEMSENQYRGMVVRVMSGKGAGQERVIMSNSTDRLFIRGKWTVCPDSSSTYCIAEGSWNFGTQSASSPAVFDIPNEAGHTIHVSARAANVHDREAHYELSPLTRWIVRGGAGSLIDDAVPPRPNFGLETSGRGEVTLGGVSFPELDNTRTISAGTWTVIYRDELEGSTSYTSEGVISSAQDYVDLNSAGLAGVGDYVMIETEIMCVLERLNDGLRYRVTRGSHGTPVVDHPDQSPVLHLRKQSTVVPFVQDFFGSPASGSYSHTMRLPNARVAAADLFVTNSRGNSETKRRSYTHLNGGGLRTLGGGQFSLQVEGHLAIQNDAAPPLVIDSDRSVRDVIATVRDAPSSAPIELRIRQNADTYCTLVIPANATDSNVVDGLSLEPLRYGAQLSLDILSVGSAAETSPGRDLTVSIRL